jgi:hypothetical protein
MDVSLIAHPLGLPSSLTASNLMSCPYTFPHSGKAKRLISTTSDVLCSLLFEASLPARYWAGSLHDTTNLLPTKAISTPSPHFALFGTTPSYAHL